MGLIKSRTQKLCYTIVAFAAMLLASFSYAQSPNLTSKKTRAIVVNPNVEDAGMLISVEKARGVLERNFSSTTEFNDYRAPDEEILGEFPSNYYHGKKVTAKDVLKTPNDQNKDDTFLWINGHSWAPERTFSQSATQMNDFQGELNGRIPWPGTEHMTANELSAEINKSKNPQSRTFYLATTCFSGIIHNVAFQNKNTCGLASASWTKYSYRSRSAGSFTSNNFMNSIEYQGADINKDGKISPYEAYIFTSKYDILNFGQINLSSSAYVDFAGKSGVYSKTNQAKHYADRIDINWERLFRSLRVNKLTDTKSICVSPLKTGTESQTLNLHNLIGENNETDLFSKEELNSLPKSYRDTLTQLIKENCSGKKKRLFNLENLSIIHEVQSRLKYYGQLNEECKERDKAKKNALRDEEYYKTNLPTYDEWVKNRIDKHHAEEFRLTWSRFKEKIKSKFELIDPTNKNCERIAIMEKEIVSDVIKLYGVDKEGINLIPAILDAKKAATFLTSKTTSKEQKAKLTELLECENKPF